MTAASEEALVTLRSVARGHAGASSGEAAAWEILGNLERGATVDFGDAFVRLDGSGKRAVILLLADIATGRTGLHELR